MKSTNTAATVSALVESEPQHEHQQQQQQQQQHQQSPAPIDSDQSTSDATFRRYLSGIRSTAAIGTVTSTVSQSQVIIQPSTAATTTAIDPNMQSYTAQIPISISIPAVNTVSPGLIPQNQSIQFQTQYKSHYHHQQPLTHHQLDSSSSSIESNSAINSIPLAAQLAEANERRRAEVNTVLHALERERSKRQYDRHKTAAQQQAEIDQYRAVIDQLTRESGAGSAAQLQLTQLQSQYNQLQSAHQLLSSEHAVLLDKLKPQMQQQTTELALTLEQLNQLTNRNTELTNQLNLYKEQQESDSHSITILTNKLSTSKSFYQLQNSTINKRTAHIVMNQAIQHQIQSKKREAYYIWKTFILLHRQAERVAILKSTLAGQLKEQSIEQESHNKELESIKYQTDQQLYYNHQCQLLEKQQLFSNIIHHKSLSTAFYHWLLAFKHIKSTRQLDTAIELYRENQNLSQRLTKNQLRSEDSALIQIKQQRRGLLFKLWKQAWQSNRQQRVDAQNRLKADRLAEELAKRNIEIAVVEQLSAATARQKQQELVEAQIAAAMELKYNQEQSRLAESARLKDYQKKERLLQQLAEQQRQAELKKLDSNQYELQQQRLTSELATSERKKEKERLKKLQAVAAAESERLKREAAEVEFESERKRLELALQRATEAESIKSKQQQEALTAAVREAEAAGRRSEQLALEAERARLQSIEDQRHRDNTAAENRLNQLQSQYENRLKHVKERLGYLEQDSYILAEKPITPAETARLQTKSPKQQQQQFNPITTATATEPIDTPLSFSKSLTNPLSLSINSGTNSAIDAAASFAKKYGKSTNTATTSSASASASSNPAEQKYSNI